MSARVAKRSYPPDAASFEAAAALPNPKTIIFRGGALDVYTGIDDPAHDWQCNRASYVVRKRRPRAQYIRGTGLRAVRCSTTSEMRYPLDAADIDADAMAINSTACVIPRGTRQTIGVMVQSSVARPAVTVSCSVNGLPVPDVRVVKHWHRNYNGWRNNGRNGFDQEVTPDLLLHDESIVVVDEEAETTTILGSVINIGAVNEGYTMPTFAAFPFADAAAMQPIELEAGRWKYLFVDVAVLADATTGEHSLTIGLTDGGETLLTMPFSIVVPAWDLIASDRPFGVYFTQTLDLTLTDATTQVGARSAVSANILREMLRACVEAGINPTSYQPLGTPASAARANFTAHLEIRDELGLSALPLYSLGIRCDQYPNRGAGPATIGADVAAMKAITDTYGIPELYIYGTDENPTELEADSGLHDAIHTAGGKVFVSCQPGDHALMSDPARLDLAVLSGSATYSDVAAWAANGTTCAKYNTPQSGPCSPALMRWAYGLRCWANDIAAGFTWCFQYGRANVFNDLDSTVYREEIFCYPQANGVIPRLAWYGYREAATDLRHLETLESLIAAAGASAAKTAAESYLSGLRAHVRATAYDNNASVLMYDMDAMRERVQQYISALIGTVGGFARDA